MLGNMLLNGNSPEVELMLLSVRPKGRAGDFQRIQALVSQSVDWNRLIELSVYHRVMPLVYSGMLRGGLERGRVPERILERLDADFRKNLCRNLQMTGELFRFVGLLQKAGIAALPYKGATLALQVYSSLALRQFRDLDILIGERDIEPVVNLLRADGHEAMWEVGEFCRKSIREVKFVHPDWGVTFELHWGLTPRFFPVQLEPSVLWTNAQILTHQGGTFRVPSIDDLLLILCLHGAKHRWARLSSIADVAWLIHCTPLSHWSNLLERASRFGGKRMVLLGLDLARDFLAMELPEFICEEIDGDPVLAGLDRQVAIAFPVSPQPRASRLEILPFYLEATERLRDRVSCRFKLVQDALLNIRCLVMTLSEKDRRLIRLPGLLDFLYYPLRILRLLKTHITSVDRWKRAFRF